MKLSNFISEYWVNYVNEWINEEELKQIFIGLKDYVVMWEGDIEVEKRGQQARRK